MGGSNFVVSGFPPSFSSQTVCKRGHIRRAVVACLLWAFKIPSALVNIHTELCVMHKKRSW